MYQINIDKNRQINIFKIKIALGQIQTTIGKAQLLFSQKFKQFRGLCVKNMVNTLSLLFLNLYQLNKVSQRIHIYLYLATINLTNNNFKNKYQILKTVLISDRKII